MDADRNRSSMRLSQTADGDAERARELRRMRAFAGGLLLLMLTVYILAQWIAGRYAVPGLSYIEAFAEAAMIGAIADWFAVTALFRHPFGLRIPHTAIIPRNKDRIGASLGGFIAENFLVPDVVVHKLRQVELARAVAGWLAEPANARFVAGRFCAGLPVVLEAVDERHVRGFVRDGVLAGLSNVEAAPALGRVLAVLVANRHHQAVFDRLVDLAGEFLRANHDLIRARIAGQRKWWWPRGVDDKLFSKIIDGIEQTLLELRDPHHYWRGEFTRTIEGYVERLSRSPEYRARGEALKEELLGSPVVLQYLDTVWRESRERLLGDLAAEDSRLRRSIEQVLIELGRRLGNDPEMLAILDRWIETGIVDHVTPHRGQIGAFIAGVVRRWDTETVTRKLELQVGKDLQYIRINGTLVGGLVGVLIHAATVAVG